MTTYYWYNRQPLRRSLESTLAALIRMMNQTRCRLTISKRLLKSRERQPAINAIGGVPADHPARAEIHESCQIQPAFFGSKWSEKQGVVELFPCFSSPNRTCAFQRIRLSIQERPTAIATSR